MSGQLKQDCLNNLSAFLLTRHWQDVRVEKSPGKALQLSFWFASEDGPIKVTVNGQRSIFFIAQVDKEKIENVFRELFLDKNPGWSIEPLSLETFEGKPVAGIYFSRQRDFYLARDRLKDLEIPIYEADVQVHDRFLMERYITGGVEISGSFLSRNGYMECINPKINVSSFAPSLKVMSLDIETSMQGDTLYSIGASVHQYLPESSPQSKSHQTKSNQTLDKTVFMLRSKNGKLTTESKDTELVSFYSSEKQVLQNFLRWFHEQDPDCIIGWSVINFDLKFLQRKAEALKLPLALGRGGGAIDWRTSRVNEDYLMVVIPGRVVLDGIDTLKSATYLFESFALDFVAKELLDRGKLIHDVDNRGHEITKLFNSDPVALAEYNIEDCVLVWEIFEHTHLMRFAIERARLTGLPMDRHGGSVASFDFRYLPKLHRKGRVAPSLQVEPQGVGSPGGYVLDSKPGLYRNVLVLDFKSLYPSIIRTFNVDPLARVEAEISLNRDEANIVGNYSREETSGFNRAEYVPGYNGAAFSKNKTILPNIIGELWRERDKAKKENNQAMSQAVKILMNSFYGVLGTPGCRFFDHRLPSSITLRGHFILKKTKQLIEERGLEVIYGDTDSVFVWVKNNNEEVLESDLHPIGENLVQELNLWWKDFLHKEYDIPSFLELEFETCFAQFVMPTIRGSELGSKKRYAGLTLPKPTSDRGSGLKNEGVLVFKGLEAVRSDWTALAKEFQRELYRRVFFDEEYESFVRQTVEAIYAGQRDELLVYRKRLRRRLNEYVKNVPPHVQAAKIAEEERAKLGLKPRYSRGAWVSYALTVNGPQPLEYVSATLNYDLYIERQIVPIVDSIAQFLNTTFDQIAGKQMGLF